MRSANIVAHVRNATIGSVDVDNTHPFQYGSWLFAHNGTVKTFASIRPLMLAAMDRAHHKAIRGQTDSEHVFHFLLSAREHNPEMTLPEAARKATRQIIEWSKEVDDVAELGLNFVLTDGQETVGLCHGQSLWYTVRRSEHRCANCTCSAGEMIHVDRELKLSRSTI